MLAVVTPCYTVNQAGYTKGMDTVDFIKQFPLHSYAKGEVIQVEGEAVDTVLYIQKGYVKVTSLDATGLEHLLWIATVDDIVPSEHLFSLHNYLRYFYATLTPVTARLVDKARLIEAARASPKIMATIAAGLSDNYDDLLERINTVDHSNIHDRLVATLRYLALRFGGGKSIDLHQVGLHLTHQDIAEMIGSTRETTSIELEKLRQRKAIDYNRSHFIIHPSLVRLA
jgi:CRP/FNR family cyclic AMP-dependent transcriptional regulator